MTEVQLLKSKAAMTAAFSMGRYMSDIPWLSYSNKTATRNQPLSPDLVKAMSFLSDLGVTMDVYSGGQPSAGNGARVGSARHDHGQSGDVTFRQNGRMLDWNNEADLPIISDIVARAKANGVTGIGAGDDYMGPGRFHIGFGAPAVWGAEGKSANAPSWLKAAYYGGKAAPIPPRNIPKPGPAGPLMRAGVQGPVPRPNLLGAIFGQGQGMGGLLPRAAPMNPQNRPLPIMAGGQSSAPTRTLSQVRSQPGFNQSNHQAAQLAAVAAGKSTFTPAGSTQSEPVFAMNGKLRNTY